MLIISQTHALLQKLIQTAANIISALHILKHHAQHRRKSVGFIKPLFGVGLNHRQTIRAAGHNRAFAAATAKAVAYAHSGSIIHPAAANNHRNIPRIGDTAQGLAD